jgi:hypothetical protein
MAAAERQAGGSKGPVFVAAKQTAIRNEDVDVDQPPASQANILMRTRYTFPMTTTTTYVHVLHIL